MIPTPIIASHGGTRSIRTPLKGPCNRLLDIQANRQELQRDLAQLQGLPNEIQWLLEILDALYVVAALLERPTQTLLEAERARLEGRQS